MSTPMRPELSKKNQYWIEKHRYYELKHFCLQYSDWKRAYSEIELSSKSIDLTSFRHYDNHEHSLTEERAVARAFYSERIELLERIANETDDILSSYIFKGVTEGISYDILSTKVKVPCCRDTYYELYRKFFWLLDKARN